MISPFPRFICISGSLHTHHMVDSPCPDLTPHPPCRTANGNMREALLWTPPASAIYHLPSIWALTRRSRRKDSSQDLESASRRDWRNESPSRPEGYPVPSSGPRSMATSMPGHFLRSAGSTGIPHMLRVRCPEGAHKVPPSPEETLHLSVAPGPPHAKTAHLSDAGKRGTSSTAIASAGLYFSTSLSPLLPWSLPHRPITHGLGPSPHQAAMLPHARRGIAPADGP